jgi:acetolactate synthase-1/3 small subunit
MLTTFVLCLANRAGVLERVAGLIRKCAVEMRSISIGPTDIPGTQRMTLVLEADENKAALVEASLHKLSGVARVENLTMSASLFRELAIVKVASIREERNEILHLASVFRARAIDICANSTTVEATGSESKIDALIEALAFYGIIEIARTGRIGMVRGLK